MSSVLIAEPPSVPPETRSSGEPGSASPWIYRPAIDLIIGCGGWSAPLLLVAFFASNAHAQGWTVGFYFVALLFNYPHFMATVYRAYHSHTEFAKYRVFTVHIALLLVAAGVVAHLWYPLLPWIFTLYICWSPWHYTGQNFGLLMMFAHRSGLAPTAMERRALRFAFVASFVMLMLSFNTGLSTDPLILSLGLPGRITLPLRGALAAFFILATVGAFSSLLRRTSLKAALPAMLLALTQFLWFLVPAIVELATGHDVPQTRYSSGILAVLHSTQYLWITSYYQRREARASGDLNWKFSTYLLTLVAGGIALFIPGPWIVSRLFHADFTASFLTFTALVNIHHFILDGALWKLRDRRIASLLLSAEAGPSADQAASRAGFISRLRWFASPARAARVARVVAALLLFGVAALDQLHFYWASRLDRLDALQRAAQLNPDDSSVQLRLARAAALAGKTATQLAALQRAASLNPGELNVQENYARGLIESGKISEAYAQYRRIIDRWPRNADALVNSGILAHQLGNDGEAVDDWQRAIDVDAAQSRAQLYLAELLEQQGQVQAAARHYRAYLQLAAAVPAENRDGTKSRLALYIKVADADATGNRAEDAQREYRAAIHMAEQSGDAELESLALAHLAELQDKSVETGDAAESYQHALALDASLADARSAAADWLNYGQFLRRHGQPEEFVFACLLHAQELLGGIPGEELSAVAQERAKSEERLGRGGAARIRANEAGELQKASSLPAAAFSVPRP
ncbi:MAG: tetratricopeptide repeat protein [Candidatus Acidiferrum sp.]